METETKTEAARGEGVAFCRAYQERIPTKSANGDGRRQIASVACSCRRGRRSSRGRRRECTGEHGHLGIWNVVVVCPVLPGTAFDMPAVCLTHIGICLPVPKQNKLQQSATRGDQGKWGGSVGGFAIAVTICVQLRKNKSKKARERTCNEWRMEMAQKGSKGRLG